MYRIPKAIDINAKSVLLREKKKLLIIGRCVEIEHSNLLDKFKQDYAIISVCLEEEHVNHVGFKIAGIIARNTYNEVSVLTVDGSMHCTQLHWMLEEIFKIMNLNDKITRKHYVIYKGKLYEIPLKAVKYSRYLFKISNLIDASNNK
ncbi:4Fe-4S ferredoxin [Desulfurococcaceae archaeon MEX13E-LK6-19]|nr:4Fe-4S ferredoxin [Desulfurococcaceae archaeon MEX13E-LK6-19]